MPSAPPTTVPTRQSTSAPLRRPKYRAARAFYLVIAILAAFALWGFLTDGAQRYGLGKAEAIGKRSGSSAAYTTKGVLARRDEEVERKAIYSYSRNLQLDFSDFSVNSVALFTKRRTNAPSSGVIVQTKRPACSLTSSFTTANYITQNRLHLRYW